MYKQLFVFILVFIIFLPCVSSDKVVLIKENLISKLPASKIMSQDKTSITNPYKDCLKKSVELLDLTRTQIKTVSDLQNQNNIVKIFPEIDTSRIKPFQNVSMPTIFTDVAWNQGITGLNSKIAVIDTGADESISHINITDKRNFCSFPFDEDVNCYHWHGCSVSSIAGAHSDLNGVSPDINFAIGRVFNASGVWCGGNDYNAIFYWASETSGANAINNSWGSSSKDVYAECAVTNYALWESYIEEIDLVANLLDTMLVFSVGNDGLCDDNSLSYESMSYNVISVGAYNDNGTTNRADDTYASFSSQGPTIDDRKKPDITAPGMSIESYGAYGYTTNNWNGTSASSPHVTGALGLLEQINITGLKAKSLLLNSADDVNSEGWDIYTGWGYLNIQNALDWNSYLEENSINTDIQIKDSNTQTTYMLPTYANFYDANSQNVKCTVVWKREFDVNGTSYLQNFDLALKNDFNYFLSNSVVDNVEQLDLNDANETQLKVFCADDTCSPDINYALSCNTDFNQIYLDYFVEARESGFYHANGDNNFSLYFDLNKLTTETKDLNLDVNVLITIGSYTEIKTLTSIGKDYNFNIDLNSNFVPISDYNIQLDFNIYSSDYNQTEEGTTYVWLNSSEWDFNTPDLYTNLSDTEYVYDSFDENLIFTDPNISYVYDAFNEVYDYNVVDSNTIVYTFDFNALNYSGYNVYSGSIYAYDAYGNRADKNVSIYYKPVFTFENYYINSDSNILYYKENSFDVNIIFTFNPSVDFNILLSDGNIFSFNNNTGVFSYDLNIDANYSYLIIKDLNEDMNVFDLNLVEDLSPYDLNFTRSNYSYTLTYRDSDINSDAVNVLLDSVYVSYDLNTDSNTLTGTLSSACGSHTLVITLYDYADNNTSYTYTYSNGACSTGGSPGGGNNNDNEGSSDGTTTTTVSTPKSISEYTISEIKDLNETGKYTLQTRGKLFELQVEDSNLPTFAIVKVIIDNDEEITTAYKGGFILSSDKYAGRTITILVYSGEIIFFKKTIIFPAAQSPNIDVNIDTNRIVPLNDNIADNNISDFNIPAINNNTRSNNNYYLLLVALILIIIALIAYPLIKFKKKKMGLSKIK